MRNRQLFAWCLAALGMISGCQPPPTPPPVVPSADQELQTELPKQIQPTRKIDEMDAQADSVNALTRKTAAFTKEMAPLLQARNNPQPPAAPSQVEWLEPGEFSLTANNAAANHAPVTQVVQTTHPAQPANPAVEKPNATVAIAAPKPQTSVNSDALSEKLSRRAKDYPKDVSAQLEYQLLQFLMDQTSPQMPAMSQLPPEDRELISAVLDGLTNFRNALRADNNMLLSKKIKPILDMSERLRSQADLTIPTIALCTKVNGFGEYDPIDPARFPAGGNNEAIVYCEVANFSSNLNDKQMWETRLTWDMTLYSEQGMSVWGSENKHDALNDAARVRRHDFFVVKKIRLPDKLPIGRYLLKVSIVDTQSNRVTEATTPIVIAAQ